MENTELLRFKNYVVAQLKLSYGDIFGWNDEYEDEYQKGIKHARDIVNDAYELWNRN